MLCTSYIFHPNDPRPSVKDLDKVPDPNWIKYQVGGNIQLIPNFNRFKPDGESKYLKAIAFCHQEGKLLLLPANQRATELWQDALGPKILNDFLVGNVIIFVGDDDFFLNFPPNTNR